MLRVFCPRYSPFPRDSHFPSLRGSVPPATSTSRRLALRGHAGGHSPICRLFSRSRSFSRPRSFHSRVLAVSRDVSLSKWYNYGWYCAVLVVNDHDVYPWYNSSVICSALYQVRHCLCESERLENTVALQHSTLALDATSPSGAWPGILSELRDTLNKTE